MVNVCPTLGQKRPWLSDHRGAHREDNSKRSRRVRTYPEMTLLKLPEGWRVVVKKLPQRAAPLRDALAAPAFEIGGDEGVVVELGIGRGNTVDAGCLTGAEDLMRVEAVRAGK